MFHGCESFAGIKVGILQAWKKRRRRNGKAKAWRGIKPKKNKAPIF
jgi:hypothetical protein